MAGTTATAMSALRSGDAESGPIGDGLHETVRTKIATLSTEGLVRLP